MRPRSRRSRFSRRFWLLLIPFLVAGSWFAWDAATYAASLRLYLVPTTSMSPTIAPGDRVCVETRRTIAPKRGELWVFGMPTGQVAIKRVIGLPGETVEVVGGRVLVNGKPLSEPYLAGPIPYAMPPTPLGQREYIVLGDNRNLSNDSHIWGPLDGRAFIGRVTSRYWPATRLGGLR